MSKLPGSVSSKKGSGTGALDPTEALLAQLLTQRALLLQEQVQADGVTAFLRRPPVRGRLNERFLQNTLRDVRTANKRAEEAEMWELREAQLERERRSRSPAVASGTSGGDARSGGRDGQERPGSAADGSTRSGSRRRSRSRSRSRSQDRDRDRSRSPRQREGSVRSSGGRGGGDRGADRELSRLRHTEQAVDGRRGASRDGDAAGPSRSQPTDDRWRGQSEDRSPEHSREHSRARERRRGSRSPQPRSRSPSARRQEASAGPRDEREQDQPRKRQRREVGGQDADAEDVRVRSREPDLERLPSRRNGDSGSSSSDSGRSCSTPTSSSTTSTGAGREGERRGARADASSDGDDGRGVNRQRYGLQGRDVDYGYRSGRAGGEQSPDSREGDRSDDSRERVSREDDGGGGGPDDADVDGGGADDGPYMMTDEEIAEMLGRYRVRGRGGVGSKADAVGPEPEYGDAGNEEGRGFGGTAVDGARAKRGPSAPAWVKAAAATQQVLGRLGLPVLGSAPAALAALQRQLAERQLAALEGLEQRHRSKSSRKEKKRKEKDGDVKKRKKSKSKSKDKGKAKEKRSRDKEKSRSKGRKE